MHVAIDLPPEPHAASAARRFVADNLRDAVGEDVASTAVLLTSELVTNVIVHAHSPMRVEVDVDPRRVRVTVCDEASLHPVLRASNDARLTGRGISLLAALADGWGVERAPPGKRVWFELPA